MKYTVKYTKKFQEDLKRAKKRGCDINRLISVVKILADGQTLPYEYSDHDLHGIYEGARECRISPDWLLVYEIQKSDLILYLMRTGTHSDLF